MIGELVNMLLDQHSEMGQFKASIPRLTLKVERMVADGSVIVARGDDGRIIATMGLETYRPYWTEQEVIGDAWIYIRHGHRSLRVFRALIAEAVRYARAANLPLLISLFSLKDYDRKARLFEKHARRILTVYGLTEMGGEFRVAV